MSVESSTLVTAPSLRCRPVTLNTSTMVIPPNLPFTSTIETNHPASCYADFDILQITCPIPSILESCMLRIFLDHPCKFYCISSSTFRTAFQCILWVPILHQSLWLQCVYKKALIYMFGDHLEHDGTMVSGTHCMEPWISVVVTQG